MRSDDVIKARPITTTSHAILFSVVIANRQSKSIVPNLKSEIKNRIDPPSNL